MHLVQHNPLKFKLLKEFELVFDFIPSVAFEERKIHDKLLNILSNPDVAKKELLIEEYEIYSKIFLFNEHTEHDGNGNVEFSTRTIDVIDWIFGYKDNVAEEIIQLGFSCSRAIDTADIESLYKDLYIPLMERIDPSTKSTGAIFVFKHSSNTESLEYSFT